MRPIARLPLYAQIKTAIARRIQEDVWSADFQVPREEELAREFETSPLTVRRALRELQAEGLLVRIQGRGTFVVGPRMQCAIFDIKDVSAEIEGNGGVHVSEVIILGRVTASSPYARLLRVAPGTPVFHSRILHKEDETPIQVEDRFVNGHEAPAYLEQDFSTITPHDYLLRETEVTSVDNTIRAIRPSTESCAMLQIDENQPCLLLDRRTWRGGIPVTRSRFLYPGDRYRLRSIHEATAHRGSVTLPTAVHAPRRVR